MFRMGISVGRNDLHLEGHLQTAPQENNSTGNEEHALQNVEE